MATYGSIGIADLSGANYTSTALAFDSVFSDRGIALLGADVAYVRTTTAGNDKWFHFVFVDGVSTSSSGYGDPFYITDATDTVLFTLNNALGGTSYTIRYLNSSVLVVGPTFFMNTNRAYTFDIHVRTGAGTGLVQVFINEVLTYSFTGLNNGTQNVKELILRSNRYDDTQFSSTYFSEMLVGEDAVSPTVGRRVSSRYPTGNSAANTGWSGAFTDLLNDRGISNGTFLRTSVAGQRKGQTFPNMTTTTINADVEAVQVSSRALTTSTTAINYGHTFRVSGVDYDQTSLGASIIIGNYASVLYLNPATGLPWTQAIVNATEIGLISI